MRIALVVTGGLHPGGTQQVIPVLLSFIDRLARLHEVHAFALRHLPAPQSYSLYGAAVHDLGRPIGTWRQWRALRRALDAHGPFDVVHGFWVDPAGLLAAIAGHRSKVPSIVTCDSGEFVSLPKIEYGLQRTPMGRAKVSLATRWATRVHVASEYMEKQARAHGIAPVRIPMGVDAEGIGLAPPRNEGPPWRALQVASLNPVKDQSTLLEALRIARQSADVRLDLVGEDTLGGRLQQKAASLGISDVVTFHGFLSQVEIAPLRHRAHLYVQSSLHEGSGIAVLEAAAAGLPIVGTSVGFVSDWREEAAVAVPTRDAAALGAAIVDVARAPERRIKLGARARAWALEHSANRTAQAMMALYASVASRRKR